MTIYDLKERLLSHSYLLFRLKRWKNRKRQRFVKKDTELVIEGYPRSANSLLVESFMLAQKRPTLIANHSHHWGQVIDGVKQGIPVVVTIRRPLDAAASLLVRNYFINEFTALSDYRCFYREILPYKDKILFIRFEDVIASPARVVRRINERFGKEFSIPDDAIKEKLSRMSLKTSTTRDPEYGIFTVCYPNEEKTRRNAQVKERLRSHPMIPYLESLYSQCLEE